LAIIGVLAAVWVDRVGWRFFRAGEGLTITLADLAQRLRAGDTAALDRFYAADFRGLPLGLNDLKLADQRDGVRVYPFRSSGAAADRGAAIAEWKEYLAGFAEIEELHLYVHRLESWWSPDDLVASIRFRADRHAEG
jgi:hypothetical protein